MRVLLIEDDRTIARSIEVMLNSESVKLYTTDLGEEGIYLGRAYDYDNLYGGIDEPEAKIIDVFICKLRKKLINASNGKDYIDTVWGRGWMLQEPSEASGIANLTRRQA